MAIPQRIVDDLMVKCGRRCCICRRYAPLHLHVHHILPESEGGTDEPDNLIVTCLTCHSDVHGGTGFGRRFTAEEVKAHRDAVFRMVAEGKLTAEADNANVGLGDGSAVLRVLQFREDQPPEVGLSRDATQMLVQAAQQGGCLHDVWEHRYFNQSVDEARKLARTKRALEELVQAGLVAWVRGILYGVTNEGFLLADALLAAGDERVTTDG